MFPAFQVVQVILISVGFFLKTDVEVCLYSVAILYQQTEPFDDVPKVKTNVKQFLLLGGVDALMVQIHGT